MLLGAIIRALFLFSEIPNRQAIIVHPFFDLAYCLGGPVCRGELRQQLEDFRVIELLDLPLDGQGEHLWVRARKKGLTTPQLADELARWASVRPVSVGYSGLKDKFAETEQWFSVSLPGREDPLAPTSADDKGWQILEQSRHSKKLRRGLHAANRFEIRVRNIDGEPEQIEQRLQQLRQTGCPNYFGEQRFGRHGDNVDQALEMFAGNKRVKNRQLRGLLVSAARSHLFNQVLSERVTAGNWLTASDGEALMLAGSRSFFVAEQIDDTVEQRLDSGDVLLSGPLWGKSNTPALGLPGDLEQAVAQQFPELVSGLAGAGLRQERRQLRLALSDLKWRWLDRDLVVDFSLPSGSFATAVLREFVDWRQAVI